LYDGELWFWKNVFLSVHTMLKLVKLYFVFFMFSSPHLQVFRW